MGIYQTELEKARIAHPREESYKYKKGDGHSCSLNRFVIFCNGEYDIVRCTLCGEERLMPCSFEENYY